MDFITPTVLGIIDSIPRTATKRIRMERLLIQTVYPPSERCACGAVVDVNPNDTVAKPPHCMISMGKIVGCAFCIPELR